MRQGNPIQEHLEELINLCKQFGVERLYTFGSVNTDKFDTKSSDVDLIAELMPMDPIEKGENLMHLWDALESLFSCKVDLLTDQPIRNPYLKGSIEKTKQLIYDRKRQKISI